MADTVGYLANSHPSLLADLLHPPAPCVFQGRQANHGGPVVLGWDAVGLGRSM